MEQEKVWDVIASEWNEFRDRLCVEVEDFLEGKGGRILDLGCGSGRNMLRKVAGGRSQVAGKIEFYGVDFSFPESAFGESYQRLA